MLQTSSSLLHDPSRLAALGRLGVLDSPREAVFDRLTRLAARTLHAPVALITIVDGERQFFKSQVGLPEPWASRRETPLSHSFCRHVVEARAPLVVEDARLHPALRDNLAIRDLRVIAYLGVPLITSYGIEAGTLCVIDTAPRLWQEEEVELLREMAAVVVTTIELRAAARSGTEPAARAVRRSAPEPEPGASADARLLARARAGEVSALLALHERHGERLYALAYALARDPSAAEAVVAAALTRAATEGDAPHPGSVRAWLCRLARECAHARAPRPRGRLAREEEAAARTLEALPEEERCALELARYARLPVEEIAGVCGVEAAVARGWLAEGLGKVRDALRAGRS
jgi:GAF domain-containing protein